MSEKTHDEVTNRLALIWALIVVAVSLALAILVAIGSDQLLPLFLSTAVLFFGPVTAVLYILEVKKGVFNVDRNEE